MKQFIVVCFLFTVFYWCQAASSSSSCESITIPMCKTLPYNRTHFPNTLFHYTQARANESINQFAHMVSTRCSAHLVFFLCAFHLPICAGQFSQPILPCRGICKKVKSDCADVLDKFKLPWPAQARCDKLPTYNNGVCIQPTSFVPPEKCSPPCPRFRINFHSFDKYGYTFVIKGRLVSVDKSGNNRVLKVRVQRVLQVGAVTLKKKAVIDIVSNASCNCEKVQKLRVREEYFIMGHEQRGKLVLTASGVLETWNKKWPKHYTKWVIRRDKAHSKGTHTHHDKPRTQKSKD